MRIHENIMKQSNNMNTIKVKIKFNQYIINSLVPKAGVCQQVHYHVSANARSVNTSKCM